jgi:hypothetical protein
LATGRQKILPSQASYQSNAHRAFAGIMLLGTLHQGFCHFLRRGLYVKMNLILCAILEIDRHAASGPLQPAFHLGAFFEPSVKPDFSRNLFIDLMPKSAITSLATQGHLAIARALGYDMLLSEQSAFGGIEAEFPEA